MDLQWLAFLPMIARGEKQRTWTWGEITLLGTMSDAKLAKKLGLSRSCLVAKRRRLEIGVKQSVQHGYEWEGWGIALLETMTDVEVAGQLAISRWTVLRKREELGVPPYAG